MNHHPASTEERKRPIKKKNALTLPGERVKRLTSKAIDSLRNGSISFLIFSVGTAEMDSSFSLKSPIFSMTSPEYHPQSLIPKNDDLSSKKSQSIFERIKPPLKDPTNLSEMSKSNLEILKQAEIYPAAYSEKNDEILDCLAIDGIDFIRNLLISFNYPYESTKEYLQLDKQINLLKLILLNKPFNNCEFFIGNLDEFFKEKQFSNERNRTSFFWIMNEIPNVSKKIDFVSKKDLDDEIKVIKGNICSYLQKLKSTFDLRYDENQESSEKQIMTQNEFFLETWFSLVKNFTSLVLSLTKIDDHSAQKRDEILNLLLDDKFLAKIQWKSIENQLKNLEILEKKWKSTAINPFFQNFLSLTIVCSGDIVIMAKNSYNSLIPISFPLYDPKKKIFTCKDFRLSTWEQTYQEYEYQIKISKILLENFVPMSNETYLHSERALLMFCYEYASDIATKFFEMCQNFESIENITIKMFSERCSCEHCSLLYLNNNSWIFKLITNFIFIKKENDMYHN